VTRDRNSIAHLAARALRRPRLVVPYLRRRLRNRRLRRRFGNHPDFYRAVMADDVARRSARGAVGTPSEGRWLAIGEMQFEYLTTHGLEPRHRLLEIGCGNLRAGWRFIEYLDISPEILLAAQRTIVERNLRNRLPVVMLTAGTDLGFLPDDHFDVVHAHSVFSHVPLDIVRAYVEEVRRVLRPGGFFDFTYNEADAASWSFLDEDFYYPRDLLLEVGEQAGFAATHLDDWHYKQEKIRLTRLRS
jgi:SAM-dependent methyltransferase